MRWSWCTIVVVVCVAGTLALPQETQGRKRRVRKKIVKVETDGDGASTGGSTGQEVKKAPRG